MGPSEEKSPPKFMTRVDATFCRILESATSIFLILLTLVVIYNAMVRFLPIDPTQMAWTEEIGRLLLLWLGFVGAGLITREEKHFVIDVFTRHMGGRFLFYSKIISGCLIIGFLVVLIKETIPVVADQMSQMTSGAVEIPLGIFSLSLLVGILIMLGYALNNLISYFRKSRGGIGSPRG